MSRQASMAVLVRHDHIHDDDLRVDPFDGPHRLLSVLGLPHHLEAARCFQRIPQAAPHNRMIVHHHHPYPICR